jgi:UDP-N-acetylmuramyl pentapeptide phosphotransferase/UDP-N-acetylglucosamine-1-phosphate transferase
MTYFISFAVFLFFAEIAYFKIADHYNIIDKPNHRSSHTAITIRGGGIIFTIAAFLFFLEYDFQYPFFILGLLLITIVSFLDDVLTLNNKIRLSIHFISVLLLFYQLNLYSFEWYWLIFAGIFIIGTINAYNFMDGINGITGGYSLVTVASLFYINNLIIGFTSNDLLIIIGLSLLVFNFFNFRTKAKCFAGDVGSVGIAFILIFLIVALIVKTENFSYILLLLLYGLDTASTVFFRKIRKENIFKAHRSHFYQYLANHLKWNHLIVSGLYMVVQLLINCVVIFVIKNSTVFALIFTTSFTILFFMMRFLVEGRTHLLKNHD